MPSPHRHNIASPRTSQWDHATAGTKAILKDLAQERVYVVKELNIFILMGQSNMSGRGDLSEVPSLMHPDVFMWRHGQWMTEEEPLHTDKPQMVGVGLGMGFAREVMQKNWLVADRTCSLCGGRLSA